MKFNPDIHHRRSIRLKGYDYSQDGVYFLTVCSYNRECLLGNIINDEMILNDFGKIVWNIWRGLELQYSYMFVDKMVVMPNHLHGILIIRREDIDGRGGSRTALTVPTDHKKQKSLGRIIGAFKTMSTKKVNEIREMTGFPIWQRNFYEHIVISDIELNAIRVYIQNNPFKWGTDRENPVNLKGNYLNI